MSETEMSTYQRTVALSQPLTNIEVATDGSRKRTKLIKLKSGGTNAAW
jgi:hypothetical protein